MGKLTLTTTLLLCTLAGKAQTVHFDINAGMPYMNVQPVSLPWFTTDVAATRLYIRTSTVDVVYTSSIYYNLGVYYYLKYPVAVDDSTTNWYTAQEGYISYLISPGLTFQQAGTRLFTYIADSATIHGNTLSLTLTE